MSKRIDIVAIGLVQHDGQTYADGEIITGVPVKQVEALLQVGAAVLLAANDAPLANNNDGAADDADAQSGGEADKAGGAAGADEGAGKKSAKNTGGKKAG